jgi:hypothetical protein
MVCYKRLKNAMMATFSMATDAARIAKLSLVVEMARWTLKLANNATMETPFHWTAVMHFATWKNAATESFRQHK